jgi:hypothetical protein
MMSGSLSPTAWVVILLVVIFVVIINLGLFTLAHKRGDEQLNASTTFKRVAHAARNPFEREDKMMAELHDRVSLLQSQRDSKNKQKIDD